MLIGQRLIRAGEPSLRPRMVPEVIKVRFGIAFLAGELLAEAVCAAA
jgi:hypothetical protein